MWSFSGTDESDANDRFALAPDAATPANICAAANSANFRVPHAAGEGSGNPPRSTVPASGALMDMAVFLVADGGPHDDRELLVK